MEIWKNIPNYEGLYQVSSLGRVKSLARVVINKKGKPQSYPEKLLKFDITEHKHSSYCRVTLSSDHKTKRYSVHRLVAEAFLPNPLNKPHVNHVDNNALNNRVNNLEWCTHSENMIHAQKQNRLFASQSKAGKKAGTLAKNALALLAKNLIGTYCNSWKLIDSTLVLRANKNYVMCMCKCGLTQLVDFSRFRRLEPTSCRKCSKSNKYVS